MHLKIIAHSGKDYEQMIQLRLQVLLNPIGIPSHYINREKEKEDILIGAFEDEEMIGCCILSKLIDNIAELQLRQMAVLEIFQGKRIGASIVEFSENIAKERGYKILIMHARDSVISFYEKCGYTIDGEQFTEVNIPHHTMKKKL